MRRGHRRRRRRHYSRRGSTQSYQPPRRVFRVDLRWEVHDPPDHPKPAPATAPPSILADAPTTFDRFRFEGVRTTLSSFFSSRGCVGICASHQKLVVAGGILGNMGPGYISLSLSSCSFLTCLQSSAKHLNIRHSF